MGCFYFVRHGETYWNALNKICGSSDIDLTEKGHKQAEAVGKEIKEMNIDADCILCSPLQRAMDTAAHIAEYVNLPIIVDNRLTEQDFGSFEGKQRMTPEFEEAKRNFACDFGGGESTLKLAQRVYGLLDELKKDDRTYILVAHNGVGRMINTYFNTISTEDYIHSGIDNCKCVKFEF